MDSLTQMLHSGLAKLDNKVAPIFVTAVLSRLEHQYQL
jgi:hypothetical protein